MNKYIAEQVKDRMEERELSIRGLANALDGVGPAQVHRIVHGENYTVGTLIKVLDFLDMKLLVTTNNGVDQSVK